MCENSIEVTLHPTLRRRHGSQSKLSHFEGTDAELQQLVLVAWKYTKPRPGRLPDTFVLSSGISPDKFHCKDGASRTLYEVVKPEAVRVDLIVRISKKGQYGMVEQIELIDFQAWSTYLASRAAA